MVFDFFKKKKEVVDLRGLDSEGIPTSGYLKKKAISSDASLDQNVPAPTPSPTSQSSNQSSGGFFSFFGGNDTSSSSSSAPASSPATSYDASPGYYSQSNNSSSSVLSSETTDKLKSQIEDISYRLSRMLDRLELVEKKMDRLERKDTA